MLSDYCRSSPNWALYATNGSSWKNIHSSVLSEVYKIQLKKLTYARKAGVPETSACITAKELQKQLISPYNTGGSKTQVTGNASLVTDSNTITTSGSGRPCLREP